MPLYEYACEQCSHEFEALVYDGEEVECPNCRGRQLRRNLSLPGRPQSTSALPMGGCEPSRAYSNPGSPDFPPQPANPELCLGTVIALSFSHVTEEARL